MRNRSCVVVALLSVSACATASSSPDTSRRNSNIITQQEIIEAAPRSVYNLIQMVRPFWLRERGPATIGSSHVPLQVYFDDQLLGDVGVLKNIRTSEIESVEYFDPGRAGARFRRNHPNGAVQLKRGGGRQ